MSTCPEKDVHSLYLDNELPPAYIGQYEEHIASCADCRAKLERLKKLHALLSQDSATLTKSQEELDQSFNRLQAKLSYSRTISRANRRSISDHVIKLKNSAGFVGALAGAAAAALVMVFLPSPSKTAEPAASQFTPVARIQIQSPDEIATQSASLLTASSAEANTVSMNSSIGNNVVFVDQTDGRSGMQAARASLASYDFFTPPVEVADRTETNSGFTFTFSVEIGNEN